MVCCLFLFKIGSNYNFKSLKAMKYDFFLITWGTYSTNEIRLINAN